MLLGSNSINAALYAAKKAKSPVMIQFSNGGGLFNAGKHAKEFSDRAIVIGTATGAFHVHKMAQIYGVPVILHTDHCQRKIISWVDGLIEENIKFYEAQKMPLFSSHMLDLSEEDLEEKFSYLCRIFTKACKI